MNKLSHVPPVGSPTPRYAPSNVVSHHADINLINVTPPLPITNTADSAVVPARRLSVSPSNSSVADYSSFVTKVNKNFVAQGLVRRKSTKHDNAGRDANRQRADSSASVEQTASGGSSPRHLPDISARPSSIDPELMPKIDEDGTSLVTHDLNSIYASIGPGTYGSYDSPSLKHMLEELKTISMETEDGDDDERNIVNGSESDSVCVFEEYSDDNSNTSNKDSPERRWVDMRRKGPTPEGSPILRALLASAPTKSPQSAPLLHLPPTDQYYERDSKHVSKKEQVFRPDGVIIAQCQSTSLDQVSCKIPYSLLTPLFVDILNTRIDNSPSLISYSDIDAEVELHNSVLTLTRVKKGLLAKLNINRQKLGLQTLNKDGRKLAFRQTENDEWINIDTDADLRSSLSDLVLETGEFSKYRVSFRIT
jgi:hypothetical protein